jgi:hypothetical protein
MTPPPPPNPEIQAAVQAALSARDRTTRASRLRGWTFALAVCSFIGIFILPPALAIALMAVTALVALMAALTPGARLVGLGILAILAAALASTL